MISKRRMRIQVEFRGSCNSRWKKRIKSARWNFFLERTSSPHCLVTIFPRHDQCSFQYTWRQRNVFSGYNEIRTALSPGRPTFPYIVSETRTPQFPDSPARTIWTSLNIIVSDRKFENCAGRVRNKNSHVTVRVVDPTTSFVRLLSAWRFCVSHVDWNKIGQYGRRSLQGNWHVGEPRSLAGRLKNSGTQFGRKIYCSIELDISWSSLAVGK